MVYLPTGQSDVILIPGCITLQISRTQFYPCSGPPADSMNYRKCVSPIMTRTQIVVGTQVGAQNKEFGTFSQTDLTRI